LILNHFFPLDTESAGSRTDCTTRSHPLSGREEVPNIVKTIEIHMKARPSNQSRFVEVNFRGDIPLPLESRIRMSPATGTSMSCQQ
jgi:hypothetical protein